MMTTKAQFKNLEQKTMVQEDLDLEAEKLNQEKMPDIIQKKRYNEAIEQMFTYENDHFIDTQFCRQTALQNEQRFSDLEWKRACDLLKGNISLFGDISTKDISQGSLGDNYLLSVMQSMALYPNSIKQLFENTEYESNGLYCVIIQGKRILLDDYFPCRNGQFAFAKPVGNKLWVILLEKAYAKFWGSYNSINGGLVQHVFNCFTMANTETQEVSDIDQKQFLEKLQENLKKNYLIIAISSKSESDDFQYQNGIINNFTYSILGCSFKNNHPIILLRNPWGKSNWRGIIYQETEDEGQFWMSLDDFFKQFSEILISKVKPDYVAKFLNLEFDENEEPAQVLLQMKVKCKINANIIVSQNNSFDSMIHFAVGHLNPKTKEITQYKGGTFEFYTNIEADYDVGEYGVYIEVDWVKKEKRELFFSYYGSSDDVDIEQFSITQEQIKPYSNNVLEGLIRAHAKTDSGKTKTYIQGLSKFSGNFSGYYYYWYQNKTNDTTLVEKLKFNTQNIQISQPYAKQNPLLVTCQPISSCMVKLKILQTSYAFSFSSAHSLFVARSEEDIIKHALMRPEARAATKSLNNLTAIVYTLNFNDGIAFVYENNESKTYKENLKIRGENLKGVNFNIDEEQKILVPPGTYKAIQLKVIDPFEKYSYSLSKSFSLV